MADENRTQGPMGGLRGKALKRTGKQNPSQGFKKKEPEIMMLKIIEGRQHPDSMKMEKMKKTTNSDGNIEFVELKAKGGRAGLKNGSKCKIATKGKGRAYGMNS